MAAIRFRHGRTIDLTLLGGVYSNHISPIGRLHRGPDQRVGGAGCCQDEKNTNNGKDTVHGESPYARVQLLPSSKIDLGELTASWCALANDGDRGD
jgi:hypothetical protein